MSAKTTVRNADLKKTSITFQTTSRPRDRYPFYNPTSLIPSECEVSFIPKDDNGVPQPDKAYTRVARYMPGMKSIWQDEWSDIDAEKRGKKLKLSFGFLNVDVRDKNLLDYLRTAAYKEGNDETNINSSVLYRELDHEQDAEKSIKKERNLAAAKNFVLNGEIGAVRAIALALAKTEAQVRNIHNMDEYSLRNSLRGAAQSNPDDFLGKMKDGSMKNKVFIVKALQSGIIRADDVEGCISWASNDEIIVESPSGMNPIDFFAELSVSNDEYKNLLENIKKMLNEGGSKKAKEPEAVVTWDEALVKEALDNGNLIQKAQWFIIPGDEEGDDAKFSIQGKSKLKSAIIDNDDNIIALLSARPKK